MYSLYNGVSPSELEPSECSVGQNYPNPFKEKTIIKYCVAYKTRVTLTIYNEKGEEIEKLVDEEQKPGTYEVEFNSLTDHSGKSKNLLDGYYFYQMIAGDYSSEKKWLCINNLLRSNKMKPLIQTLFFFLLTTQICFGQWYPQNSGTTKILNAVYFLDENTGWAVGEDGTILKTTDSGSEWIIQQSVTEQNLTDIQFVDANDGWIVSGYYLSSGEHALILKTTNGGSNWFQQLADTTYVLNSVYLLDANTGWAAGGIGTILKTTDAGNNWVSQNSGTDIDLRAVHFIDPDNGWAVGGSWSILGPLPGVISKTTDGGTNWISWIDTLTWFEGGRLFYSVYFIDSNTGWAVGFFDGTGAPATGVILKTTDGGLNWVSQNSGTDRLLTSVYFIDSNTGYAVGGDWVPGAIGVILKTTDGGTNWISQDTYRMLTSVYFTDSNNGWAVGANGTILHTTNGGVSFIDDVTTQPTEFILSQSYPNPFNSSCAIRYSIPQLSQVSLKVFNTLGEEIQTLVNEEKPVGTYELNWYASNLPSGVYFYKLQSGQYTSVKKMILLK